MRPKFLQIVIGVALLVLLAAWSLAPKATVTNQTQPQPVELTQTSAAKHIRPMVTKVTTTVEKSADVVSNDDGSVTIQGSAKLSVAPVTSATPKAMMPEAEAQRLSSPAVQ